MVSIDEARAVVREALGIWLSSGAIYWWCRRGMVPARQDSGRWLVDAEEIVSRLRAGSLGRGVMPTSREAALVAAVDAAGGKITEERARVLLALADGVDSSIKGRIGRPKDGRRASLAANIQVECGVSVTRNRLSDFF